MGDNPLVKACELSPPNGGEKVVKLLRKLLSVGWEARVDSHGRVFYIDHVNRQTTWQKPQSGQRSIHRRPTISSEQRQQMDRRYQSIRRTIRQTSRQDLEPTSNSAESSSSGRRLQNHQLSENKPGRISCVCTKASTY